MNFKASLSKFLTNNLVLNIVSLLALFNVIGYMVMGYFNVVILFIVIAILVRYFSKNMIIVLGIPLIFVNLMSLQRNTSFEGFEGENKEAVKDTIKETEQDNHKKIINKINKQVNKKTSQGLPQTPLEPTAVDTTTTDTSESFEAGRRKNRGNPIDYASTIEDAYDQLNSILGSDGIQRLTEDSQRLMKQQSQLAESMKQMGPLIKGMEPMLSKAQEMMSSMGDDKAGLGNMMEIAKNFSKNFAGAPANK